uniref:C2 NT-type domain-containing protein n=1 Tax=Spongospora subterranea TaxID=70186 RepID=A0A0H5R5B0_9EUKA|eukprot:CRZ09318.1 hypothetical protein [Spongospora subterranea]
MWRALVKPFQRKKPVKFQVEFRIERIEKYPFEGLELTACWTLTKYKGRTHPAKVNLKQQVDWNETFVLPEVVLELDKKTCHPKRALAHIEVSDGKSIVGAVSFDINIFLSSRAWQSERFSVDKSRTNCRMVISVKTIQTEGTPLFYARQYGLKPLNLAVSPSGNSIGMQNIDPTLRTSLLGLALSRGHKSWSPGSSSDANHPDFPSPHNGVKHDALTPTATKHETESTQSIYNIVERIMSEGQEGDIDETTFQRHRHEMLSELTGPDPYQYSTI